MIRIHARSCRTGIYVLITSIAVTLLLFILFFFTIAGAAAFSPLIISHQSVTSLIAAQLVKITLDTCKIAFGSTCIALIIGLPAAFFTSQRQFPLKKQLVACSAVPLCIPALIIALGYVTWIGNNGLVNIFFKNIFHFKEPPFHFLYSFTGIIIAQGFYNFPLIMGTVSNAWEQLPSTEADAARLLGASENKVFFTITVPQLLASIVSACIPVFIYCFFGFLIVLLLGSIGCTTLEVEIYRTARNTLQFHTTAALALFETLIAILIITSSVCIEQRTAKSKGLSFYAPEKYQKIKSLKEKCIFTVLTACILFFFIFPLLGIFLSSFISSKGTLSLKTVITMLSSSSFVTACKNTIVCAFFSALLCIIVATTYALISHSLYKKHDTPIITTTLKTIPMLPMIISSVVFGFGLSLLIRRGNALLLTFAQAMLYWPFAFRQIYPYLARIPKETEDAATLLSPSRLNTIYTIYLPSIRQGICNAFCFCFAISCGDTALPLVLSIPRFDTLALYTYRLASAYKFSQACASGTILGIICILVFSLSQKRKLS
ncbi:MAG: iron ABC transporter permease [Treponema sp.]|nr:iron ABC transporter permease [Treponema sp.]